MDLGMCQFHTDDLSYWPDLYRLDPQFLATVDRFYQYFDGKRILLWTHDDRVYRMITTDDHEHWVAPFEVCELSHQHVVHVYSSIPMLTLLSLTLDGRLFIHRELPGNTNHPRVVLFNIRQVALPFALTNDGMVGIFDHRHVARAILYRERHFQFANILSMAVNIDLVATLTTSGDCLVKLQNRDRLIRLPQSHLCGLALCPDTLYTLTLSGLVTMYRIHCVRNRIPENDVICLERGQVVPFDQPIRRMVTCHGQGYCFFESQSGLIYSSLNISVALSSGSIADVCSLFGQNRLTLDITKIMPWARLAYGRFNNPTIPQVIRLTRRTLPEARDDTKCFYITRTTLYLLLNSPEHDRQVTLIHGRVRGFADLVLFNYLKQLTFREQWQNVHACALDLYELSHNYADDRLEVMAVEALARTLGHLFRTDRVRFEHFLNDMLLALRFELWPGLEPAPRTQTDRSLQARMIRYITERCMAVREQFVRLLLEPLEEGIAEVMLERGRFELLLQSAMQALNVALRRRARTGHYTSAFFLRAEDLFRPPVPDPEQPLRELYEILDP